tara:strand:+ start:10065 stop:11153 length:1089 start_codon:yes stop_codon:yes gene_type:complete
MCSIFIKREYDVVFYYPQHFNRGSKDENIYFSNLINACRQEGLSYTVFEEPDFSLNSNRNMNAIPFDFIFVIIILLRRLFNSEMDARTKDVRIGGFLSKTFFRCISFNNVVTISQSMVSTFRGINSNCMIFDVQHGIIHPNKKNYLIEKHPDKNIMCNKMQILLSGDAYKQLMIENDYTKYFKNNSHVIGSYIIRGDIKHDSFNKNILVSLQFTSDHSNAENILLLQSLEQLINYNADETITFYLKNHPRFNFDVNLKDLLSLKNVKPAPVDVNDCFELCSLQITAYSTLVFEAALKGIPTILINPLSRYNYFKKYFSYPFSNQIIDFSDKFFYKKSSFIVQRWASSYYSNFDKETFIKLLK